MLAYWMGFFFLSFLNWHFIFLKYEIHFSPP